MCEVRNSCEACDPVKAGSRRLSANYQLSSNYLLLDFAIALALSMLLQRHDSSTRIIQFHRCHVHLKTRQTNKNLIIIALSEIIYNRHILVSLQHDDDRLPRSFEFPWLLADTRAESYCNIHRIF